MKSKLAICAIILSIAWKMGAAETLKGWSEWMSEGAVLRGAGKYPAAIAAFRQALGAAEVSKETNIQLVQALDSLATAYVESGQFAEAEHQYRRALASVETVQGRKSLTYAVLLASWASISGQVGSSEETIATLREAVAVHGRVGDTRSLAIVRECLGQILVERKEYAEAEALFLETRASLAHDQTSDPVFFSTVLNNLAHLRYQQRRFEESFEMYLESSRMLRAALGDDHPAMVPALNNLALNYFQVGHLDEADKTFQQAVTICNHVPGDHPTCGEVYENYAGVLRKLKRNREAKKLEAQSQQIRQASERQNGVGMTVSVLALRSDKN
jgi:tetratricopeptide (TPR) repeat protein